MIPPIWSAPRTTGGHIKLQEHALKIFSYLGCNVGCSTMDIKPEQMFFVAALILITGVVEAVA
jgi:hypothetical protein